MTKILSTCLLLAVTAFLHVGSAAASGYTDWLEVFLKIAASEEESEDDSRGQNQFLDLGRAVAQTASPELPEYWSTRLKIRSKARRAQHARYVGLQSKLDGLSKAKVAANAKAVAHAQVDLWHSLHELSETLAHVNSAESYLDHAAHDLSNLRPADRDGDGITDDRDRCPNEPEDHDGWQDADGCPDTDNDGDGILDVNDRCPNQAETKNNFRDHDGCPDDAPPAVLFGSDSSVLDASARASLSRTTDLLKGMRGLSVQVVGHTDSRNGDSYNESLGMRRAVAVRNYLIKTHGIDASRLGVSSEGEGSPAADNATRSGRADNRRVVFAAVE